jgi:hypothetical protein
MKPQTLAFVGAGIFLLAAAAFMARQHQRVAESHMLMEQLRAQAAEVPELKEELDRLRLRSVESGQGEGQDSRQLKAPAPLDGARRSAGTEAGEAQAKIEPGPAEETQRVNGFAAPTAELAKSGLQQSYRNRLSRMEERLGLSPTQVEGIGAILERKAEALAEGMKGVYSGKMDEQKIAELQGHHKGDPESQICALLSPEQQTAYAAFRDEERADRASLSANTQLLQMQHTLGIQEEQREKVFAVLYDENLEQLTPKPEEPKPENPVEAMKISMERKLKALEAVLTPSQLAGYRSNRSRSSSS